TSARARRSRSSCSRCSSSSCGSSSAICANSRARDGEAQTESRAVSPRIRKGCPRSRPGCPRSGATSIYSRPPAVGTSLEPSINANRAALEEVGVLLHPADRLRDRHLVSVLLDARHGDPTGRRALPFLEGGEQCALLEAPADVRALPRPDGQDNVPAVHVAQLIH